MIKRTILALAIAILSAFAANGQSYKVSMQLKDAQNDENVGFATVSLTPDGSHKATKYVLSDSHGKAVLERVRTGKYTVHAELLGYKTAAVPIEVKSADLDLGTIKMEEDREVLDAAQVSAVGNPIVIKKDTVEYNASSFMTTDNDALEELLKKLPGVEVNEDGSVTANGETISKITIDGKTFFLDDPQLATKNLPAKIVEKVKVVKKKSEQAEFTGIDDGNEEYVIDLSIKKGMMNGVFGNIMAGGGHDIPADVNGLDDWRYQGAAMVGKFTSKTQLSLILNANNTNNRGFNDLSGSMMQSIRGSGGRGMGRGQGGWGNSNGITTSYMGGVNGAWTLFDDKMDLSGNYLYNYTDKQLLEQTYKETYQTDGSTLIYKTDPAGWKDYNNTVTQGHRFGFRLDHKFSESTSILVQPQFEFGSGRFNELSKFATDNLSASGVLSNVNNGFAFTDGGNRNVTARGFALFRQRLGIPGRTVSVMSNWNFSNNDISGYNQSNTHTFANNKDNRVNQRYDQNAKNRSVTARAVYTEPLGHDLYLEGSYSYSWRKNSSWKNTFDSGSDPAVFDGDSHVYIPEGETPNLAYTNTIDNTSYSHNAGLTLAYQEGKTRAQAGLSVNTTSTFNLTNDGGTEKKYEDKNRIKFSPRAMVFYDINDNTELRLFYFGRSNQPSTNQLMAVADNSNPLNVSFGNPALYPYFNHDLRSEFSYSNKKTFFTFRGTLEGGFVQDPIVSATWTDNAGVTYTMPVNGDNTYNGSFRMFLNYPILKSNFSVSLMSRTSYSETNSFIGEGISMDSFYNSDGSLKYDDFVQSFSNIGSRNDFIHNKTQSLSMIDRLRLTYRNDNLEVTASGRTRFSKPWYTIATANENATWNNQLQSTFSWKVNSIGLTVKADANYNWYNGYTTPREDEYIVNAEIDQLLFKKSVTLALRCYDIFNQAKNLSVTDATNYHQEVWNNTLGRYIILSLTWRFGNFGNAKNMRMGPRMGGPGGPGGRGPR